MKENGILDRLWRSVGKDNADCEVCRSLTSSERVNYTQLHPHHIIKRGHKTTKWLLRNRVWLCPSHHTLGMLTAEHNEGGWFLNWESDNDWMGQNRHEDKEFLREKRFESKKWTLDELLQLKEDLENFS